MTESTIPRSLPRDTWRWVWQDTLIRLVPFWLVAGIAAHFMGGWASVGLQAAPQGWLAALALGVPSGLGMLVLAVIWRGRIAPRYRLPTHADQALQTFFYLVMNAPTEELFWRGALQTLAIRGLLALGLAHALGMIGGVAGVSVIFGAYHRLGNYPWRFNIAAMLAGAVFGTLFAVLPGPSIVVPTIVHGLTTAGYLSWGDVALHWRKKRGMRPCPPTI
jgi:membrane protease YdiL (CAAX protease family)